MCNEDPKSAEIIKPILRGSDIKRYSTEWADLWLINSHNNPPVKIDDYPAIKKHLDAFYPQLEKRQDKGATPYNLRNCAYLKEFEREKIVYREISDAMNATYLDQWIFCNNKTYIVTGENLKYLLSIFNSTLFNNVILKSSNITGGKGEGFLSQIPIPKIPESEQQPFIKLVDYILFIKKQPFYTSTDLDFAEERLMSNFFENLIDALVYELYFPEELHEAQKKFMSLVIQENFPDLDAIEGDKVGALKQIVRRLTDKNHPLYNNLFFLDSVPVVRIIEGKA